MKRIDSLDGLRGLTAVFVVLGHTNNQVGTLDAIFGEGAALLGVMIFFALSAFLMARLYEAEPASLSGILAFFRARAARVVPLYFLIVISSAVLWGRTDQPILYQITAENLLAHLTLMSGTSVLWSVPMEARFYVLFPFIWLLGWLSRVARNVFLVALAVLSLVTLPAATSELLFLPFFLAGLLAADATLSPRIANVLFGCSAVCLIILLPSVWKALGLPSTHHFHFIALISGLLVLSCAHSSVAKRFLGSRPLRFLGTISFSIYLLHWPVQEAITFRTSLTSNPLVYVVAVLAASVAVASVSYFAVEAPAARYIRGKPPVPRASKTLLTTDNKMA